MPESIGIWVPCVHGTSQSLPIQSTSQLRHSGKPPSTAVQTPWEAANAEEAPDVALLAKQVEVDAVGISVAGAPFLHLP